MKTILSPMVVDMALSRGRTSKFHRNQYPTACSYGGPTKQTTLHWSVNHPTEENEKLPTNNFIFVEGCVQHIRFDYGK